MTRLNPATQWALLPGGPARVYQSPDGATFTVADDSGWYPGAYASEAAARLAPSVDIKVLERNTHWQVRGQGDAYRPVTLAEMQSWSSQGDSAHDSKE